MCSYHLIWLWGDTQMISCIRSVWKCSQMLSVYSVLGGPKVDQMISTISILFILWSTSGFLIFSNFSHFFSCFLIFLFFLIFSHFISSVVVLCSIVEGWVFSFFLISSHFFSFHLIFSHFISFFLISHLISDEKMHIYAPCSCLVCQLFLWQKRNLSKNSLGQMLGSRRQLIMLRVWTQWWRWEWILLWPQCFRGWCLGCKVASKCLGCLGCLGCLVWCLGSSSRMMRVRVSRKRTQVRMVLTMLPLWQPCQWQQLQQLQLEKLGRQKIFTRPCWVMLRSVAAALISRMFQETGSRIVWSGWMHP